jgi:hypothetical protein
MCCLLCMFSVQCHVQCCDAVHACVHFADQQVTGDIRTSRPLAKSWLCKPQKPLQAPLGYRAVHCIMQAPDI